jgi:hypothetical protein
VKGEGRTRKKKGRRGKKEEKIKGQRRKGREQGLRKQRNHQGNCIELPVQTGGRLPVIPLQDKVKVNRVTDVFNILRSDSHNWRGV